MSTHYVVQGHIIHVTLHVLHVCMYRKRELFFLLLYLQYRHIESMYIVSYCMSAITQWGGSALMLAAVRGKTEVVVELVKAGANVDMQSDVCQCIYVVQHVHMHVALHVLPRFNVFSPAQLKTCTLNAQRGRPGTGATCI